MRLDWRPRSATPALQDAWSWGGPLLANIPEAPRAPGSGAPEPLPWLGRDAMGGQGSGGGGPAAAPITAQPRDGAWTRREKFLRISKAGRGGEPGAQSCRKESAGTERTDLDPLPPQPPPGHGTPGAPGGRRLLPRVPRAALGAAVAAHAGIGRSGPLAVAEPLRLPGAQPALGGRGAARVRAWGFEAHRARARGGRLRPGDPAGVSRTETGVGARTERAESGPGEANHAPPFPLHTPACHCTLRWPPTPSMATRAGPWCWWPCLWVSLQGRLGRWGDGGFGVQLLLSFEVHSPPPWGLNVPEAFTKGNLRTGRGAGRGGGSWKSSLSCPGSGAA